MHHKCLPATTVMTLSCKEFLSLTAVVVVVLIATTEGSCVSSFAKFEQIAIKENEDNQQEIRRSFYGVNQPFPLSVQVVYHVNSSNGTDTIISTDPTSCPPGKEMWLWVPSPIFIFLEPTKLNEFALRTMNYFMPWKPQKAHIHVPEICDGEHTQFNILNEMTSRIQAYALSEYSGQEQGYVLRGCGEHAATTLLTPTQRKNRGELAKFSVALVSVYTVGGYFQTVIVMLVSAMLLHFKGNKIAQYTSQTSYDHYGLFWGYIVTSLAGNIILLRHSSNIARQSLLSGVLELKLAAYAQVVLVVGALVVSLLIAMHFGRKLQFSIPSIFLWCFVIPCCNQKRLMKKTVQILSLWSVIYFQTIVMGYTDFVFFALLATPDAVVSTLLLLLFAAFCSIHFFAILFKSSKLKRSLHLKSTALSILISVAQTLVATIGFAAAFCFGLVICCAGALVNYRDQDSKHYPTLSTVVTPLALAAFGWALRQIGSQWLKFYMSARDAPHEEQGHNHKLLDITNAGEDEANVNEHVHVPYISWLRERFRPKRQVQYEPIASE